VKSDRCNMGNADGMMPQLDTGDWCPGRRSVRQVPIETLNQRTPLHAWRLCSVYYVLCIRSIPPGICCPGREHWLLVCFLDLIHPSPSGHISSTRPIRLLDARLGRHPLLALLHHPLTPGNLAGRLLDRAQDTRLRRRRVWTLRLRLRL